MTTTRPSPDPIYILRGSKNPVTCLKFEGNDRLLSANSAGTVNCWSMSTRRIVDTVPVCEGHSCLWLDVTDNGQSLLTQGRNGHVIQLRRTEGGWVPQGSIVSATAGFCNSCLVNRDSAHLLAVPSDLTSTVDLVDLASLKVIGQLTPSEKLGKAGMCMKMVSATDGKLLIGYEDGTVALWDTRQTNMAALRVKIHEDTIMCMDYNAKTHLGYSGSANEKIYSWTVKDNAIAVKDTVTITNPGLSECTVREDGKVVAFGCWDSNIRLFSGKSLKPLAVLSFHNEGVDTIAFSEDKTLACGSKDHMISLWEVYR